jgi:hypothetical protein
MLGPSMAKALYNAIENDIPLDSAIDKKIYPKVRDNGAIS